MPNIVDFNSGIITDIKSIIVKPKGWVSPIFIEYGLGLHYGTLPSYFWRVKGTKHTFVIPIIRLHFLSSGNYEKHFSKVLEGFREDYMEWKINGFQYNWQQEYQKEYSKFII